MRKNHKNFDTYPFFRLGGISLFYLYVTSDPKGC